MENELSAEVRYKVYIIFLKKIESLCFHIFEQSLNDVDEMKDIFENAFQR